MPRAIRLAGHDGQSGRAGQGASRVARSTGTTLWVAAERRALFEPALRRRMKSLVDIVRGRLEGLGPVTAAQIAESLGPHERRRS